MNRTIEAMVRLSAKLGPMAAFGQMGAKLADVNRKASTFNKTQSLVARGSDAATAAMVRFAAPAAIAYGAQRAVREFAGVERTLTRIGINADASREQMADVYKELQQIAQATATPVDNIVSGLDSLIASGKSLDEAMALIGSVSATAQAAGADFGQMATTADAVSNSFGIAGESMQGAFDILAMGGKAGKFELRDMAAELPSLAPAFSALGYEGEDGLKRLTAALQTVRMETGTSGEAATSFMDVLTKMNSVTISNSFKKQFGVDLRSEMKKAKAAGEDTLEAFIRLSKEAVNGDMSKLPLLFTDKQMLIGMRALMNHTEEYRDLFKELGSAAGTVGIDLKRVFDDSQGSIDRMANSWDRLKTSFGETIAPAAAGVMDSISGSIDRASAVNAGLEKTGTAKGWWARTGWGISSSDAEKDSMAWVGGYRTDEQRAAIAAYSTYRDSAAAAPSDSLIRTTEETEAMLREVWGRGPQEAVAPMPERIPGAVPIPQARPSDFDVALAAQDAARNRGDVRVEAYAASRTSLGALADADGNISLRPRQRMGNLQGLAARENLAGKQSGSDLVEGDQAGKRAPERQMGAGHVSLRPGQNVPNLANLLSRVEDAGSQSGTDLAQGGEDAARAISQAAPEAGNGFGDAAASRIKSSAEEAGAAFGEAAAAKIRAAVGQFQIRGSSPSGTPKSVSGNRGRTMPQAGQAGRAQ